MRITHNNRWLIIVGTVIVQLTIGTIYSWSLFNYPLMRKFNWSENQVVLTFSIATFMFAFSTIFAGRLLDRFGPRIIATIGGVLYGGGLILSSSTSSIFELYLFYGVLSGLGVGFVYVCPIATCVKWFPNKKGLITGIAVGAFGLGSLVFKYIIQAMLSKQDILNTFLILGIIYLVLIVSGAQLLINPKSCKTSNNQSNDNDLNVKQMLKDRRFYTTWILFYLGCLGGLLVIGLAVDIGVKFVGLSLENAANTVALIALFNAFGRIIWGHLSDKIGRIQVVAMMFILTLVSMLMLGLVSLNLITFFIVLAVIAFCFGGFLSIFPTITEESFGHTNFGANYGVMYQAYGIAALSGPIVLTLIPSLHKVFLLLAAMALLGFMVSIYKLKVK